MGIPRIRSGNQGTPQNIISSVEVSNLIRERWGESIRYTDSEIREAFSAYNRYQSQLVSYDNHMRGIWEQSNNTSDATNQFQGILNRIPDYQQTRFDWTFLIFVIYCLVRWFN